MTKSQQDKIGRKEIVNNICEMVENLKTNSYFCLALNGEWGSGKSFVLEYVGEELEKQEEHVVVKYDAWENAFYSDPLIAILSCVMDGVRDKLKKTQKFKELTKHVLKVLSKKNSKLKTLCDAYIEIKNLVVRLNNPFSHDTDSKSISEFKSYKTLINEVKHSLNSLTKNEGEKTKQKKLVILVDEIDRCLPNEQLTVLERLHHLFNINNCAVICAINKHAIVDNFNKRYALNGWDYLQKFFDHSIDLDTASIEYLNSLFKIDLLEKMNGKFKVEDNKRLIISALSYISSSIKKKKVNLNNRAVNRYYNNLISVLDNLGWKNFSKNEFFFIVVGLFVRQFIEKSFLIKGKKGKKLHDYVKRELAIEARLKKGETKEIDRYKDKYLNNFNIIANHIAKDKHWNYYDNGSDLVSAQKSRALKSLILTYGGQYETSEARLNQ